MFIETNAGYIVDTHAGNLISVFVLLLSGIGDLFNAFV
jgi:hypothetical protein